MNNIFKTLTLTRTVSESGSRTVKTSGTLYDYCTEQLKLLGLTLDNCTPYQYGVYRNDNAIGYYNTLTEIKQAIKAGTVTENYNL